MNYPKDHGDSPACRYDREGQESLDEDNAGLARNYNVVVIGDQGVGKSAFVAKFVENSFEYAVRAPSSASYESVCL